MEKLPRALQLADWLDEVNAVPHPIHTKSAAAELRRLHEVNAELVEALKAALSDDQPYIEKCKAAIAKATGENHD